MRGRFELFKDANDSKFKLLISKWYYLVEVDYHTDLYIYLHQEPEQCNFVFDYRPYLSASVIVYEISKHGELEVLSASDFV